MRALLLANSDDCDAGFSGERFRHHGYSFIECHRDRPGDWPSLEGIDLVMLMGSHANTAALLTTFDMQLHKGTKPMLPIP